MIDLAHFFLFYRKGLPARSKQNIIMQKAKMFRKDKNLFCLMNFIKNYRSQLLAEHKAKGRQKNKKDEYQCIIGPFICLSLYTFLLERVLFVRAHLQGF